MNAVKPRILIVLLICTQIGRAADPLDTWTWRNPLPTGNSLSDMEYGNGQFVAVGRGGTALTSSDGVNWVLRVVPELGMDNTFLAICYGNGLFVAVGGGTILTSGDQVNWAQRQPETTNQLLGITYGNGMFVTVGDVGTILTSADTVSWAQHQSGTTNQLRGITYGNGLFVVVGDHGTILTSRDSVKWAGHQSGSQDFLNSVAYGNGQFVTVGHGAILTSADGDNWRKRQSWDLHLNGVAFGNGQFVAVGDELDFFPILTSADGVNWVSRSASEYDGYHPGGGGGAHAVAYGAGHFVTVGSAGIWTSPDGVNWVRRPTGTRWLWSIAYGNGHFVGVGTGGSIVQSGRIVTLKIARNTTSDLLSLSLEGPTGLGYTIQTSTDLVSWRDVTKISNAPSSKVVLDGLPVTSERQFYRVISE